MWQRFEKESPKIRDRLETEFRAALGERRAKLCRSRYAIQDVLASLTSTGTKKETGKSDDTKSDDTKSDDNTAHP